MSDRADGTGETPDRPVLRVVSGNPSDAEIAALVAVLAARSSAAAPSEPPPATSAWTDRAALVRAPLRHGPGAWRASGWPHSS